MYISGELFGFIIPIIIGFIIYFIDKKGKK